MIFKQCGIFTIVDSDEPVKPPSVLINSSDTQSVAYYS